MPDDPEVDATTERLVPEPPEGDPAALAGARRRSRRLRYVLYGSLLAAAALWWQYNRPGAQPGHLALPDGFTLGVFASGLDDARSLALGDSGTVFVGTRRDGRVWALQDTDGDGRAEVRHLVAEGLTRPNGVAFRDGVLYVAEVSRILRFDDIEQRLTRPPAPRVVYDGLPTESHHGWKYLQFGPDGALYFGVGAPCNICLEPDPRFATIMRLGFDSLGRADSAGPSIWARGVRNTVGFDWHPDTGELWFTDNGRDWLGDDVPPDELNHAPQPGAHYGFPYCHGTAVRDPEFGRERPCAELTPPVLEFGAHTAPLGLTFYRGDGFPEEYRGDAFVAQHGSWNRSNRVGYRVLRVRFEEGRAVRAEVFADGWLRRGRVSGRPVDVLELRDGSLLVSDDQADAIYRIAWTGQATR